MSTRVEHILDLNMDNGYGSVCVYIHEKVLNIRCSEFCRLDLILNSWLFFVFLFLHANGNTRRSHLSKVFLFKYKQNAMKKKERKTETNQIIQYNKSKESERLE